MDKKVPLGMTGENNGYRSDGSSSGNDILSYIGGDRDPFNPQREDTEGIR